MRRERNRDVVIENEAEVKVNPHMAGLKSVFDAATDNVATSASPALKSIGTIAISGLALYLISKLPNGAGPDDDEEDDEEEDYDDSDDD